MEQVYIQDYLNNKEDREEIFSYIFENYFKRVYNYVFYRVNCQQTAEDLTSTVFEKVMLKIDTYSDKKASFEVWMFAIARNVLNDYFRSLKRHTLFSLDNIKNLVSRQQTPEEVALREEANEKLFKCLKILNEKERNIVALKYGANLKNVEIAEVIGISSDNVGVMLYRVLKKLKNQMEREGYMYE